MSIPSNQRKNELHVLWLTLISIAVRNEIFSPTPKEAAEIGNAAAILGLAKFQIKRMEDTSRRFAQIQSELQTIGDPSAEFERLGKEWQELSTQQKTAMREWHGLLRPVEVKRRKLAQQILRAKALRTESEILQTQATNLQVEFY